MMCFIFTTTVAASQKKTLLHNRGNLCGGKSPDAAQNKKPHANNGRSRRWDPCALMPNAVQAPSTHKSSTIGNGAHQSLPSEAS
eukprot:2266240-Amphidinium_carterae.1